MAVYKFEDIAFNSTEKKKPVEEDKHTYLGLEHLDSDSIYITRFGADVAPKGEKLLMRKGDVLFGKRRAYQKKVAIAPFDGIFSAHGMVLRPKEEVIDKDFFPLFIKSDYFLDEAIKISVGSLSPTINWRDLKELKFSLPSLEEQKKLAQVLWAIYETKEEYKKLIKATDDLVKSQFIEMFSSEEVEEMLEDCAYIEKGKMITRDMVIKGDIPVVAAGIEPSCYHNQSNRDAGIITVSASGANAGYVNYWDEPIFASDCNTILTKNKDRLDNVFLFCRLKVIQQEIYAMQQGTGQPHVYAKCLSYFMGVDRTIEGWEGLLAAQECIPSNKLKDEFAADYRVLNKAWNALSPDPFLEPFKFDYVWLSKVYESVKPTDNRGALVWAALGAKTLELVHQNIQVGKVHEDVDILTL
ncbi:MAG: restriction endonuclease subunit S, partial [Lachnospiraceae bacterium]|nr:restriction endonuclease subunit S [Lachnospiraceae bacterium]